MSFATETARKNVKRKPLRSGLLAAIVMLLTFSLFAGAFTIISLQQGLQSYRTRLGADVIVVPVSATSQGSVDDIFLQGITSNNYMSDKDCQKVLSVDGIEAATKQFYLTSAKASCCSTRVQIIGFDPETDFSIQPWIGESFSGTIGDDDIVVGSNISVPADRKITFYNHEYNVAAQLEQTGTGLDSAVYTNMKTIRQMAENAQTLLKTSPFRGVDLGTAASAILIKVADGYEIGDVADDINIHITKVKATSARSMISGIVSGLDGVSRIIGILIAAVWVLAVVILIAVFAMLSNERKKEFAVLRTMGASRKMLFRIMSAEAVEISLIGSALGLLISLLLVLPFSGMIKSALGLPFLTPSAPLLAGLALAALAVSVLTGLLASVISAHRITKSETGLLMREDA